MSEELHAENAEVAEVVTEELQPEVQEVDENKNTSVLTESKVEVAETSTQTDIPEPIPEPKKKRVYKKKVKEPL